MTPTTPATETPARHNIDTVVTSRAEARGHRATPAPVVRAALGLCLLLGCALGAGSCAPGQLGAPVASASVVTAAPRARRTPPRMEGCKETVVIEAPVCGGPDATHGL